MKFEIKSWPTGGVLFSIETDSWKLAVEAAVKARANLAGADLAGANLAGADLAGANLAWANLAGANLAGANLAWANLAGANLAGADLARANLAWANLSRANLARADLARADLARANLAGANLAGANLAGYISIGPIGSRQSYIWARWEEGKYIVHTGCFSGDLKEFSEAVKNKHAKGVHRDEYLLAVKLLERRAKDKARTEK